MTNRLAPRRRKQLPHRRPIDPNGQSDNSQRGYALPVNGIVGSFTDAAGAYSNITDFTATIAWGDGATTTVTSGGAGSWRPAQSTFNIEASHTYSQLATGLTYSVTVTDIGGATATQSTTINVNELPPTVDLSANATTVNEVSVYTLTMGAVTDPYSSRISGFYINWGDGLVNQVPLAIPTVPSNMLPVHWRRANRSRTRMRTAGRRKHRGNHSRRWPQSACECRHPDRANRQCRADGHLAECISHGERRRLGDAAVPVSLRSIDAGCQCRFPLCL